MCPICWISGFVAAIFGGSLLAVVNHPISWILSGLLIAYAAFKFYEAKQKGNKMTKETKARNRRTIFRFVQGVVLGSIVTTIIFSNILEIVISFGSIVISIPIFDNKEV